MTDTGFTACRLTAQDGISLYYRDYAPAADKQALCPILCLSGLARNSGDYHRLAMTLSERGHRVIAPDYRGRGQSGYDPNPMNYLPATYIGDIRHLLTLLNLHQVIVIGTSLGGLLAMGMGAAMPTVLKAVVLNDVGPDINPDGLDRIVDYLSNSPELKSWDEATAMIKAMFSQVQFDSEEEWQELARNTFREDGNGVLRYDWDTRIVEPMKQGVPIPDLWPLFRSLFKLPVLAFRGEVSDILKPQTFERMAEENPDMITITVPGVGHVPSLREDISKKALNDFLNRL